MVNRSDRLTVTMVLSLAVVVRLLHMCLSVVLLRMLLRMLLLMLRYATVREPIWVGVAHWVSTAMAVEGLILKKVLLLVKHLMMVQLMLQAVRRAWGCGYVGEIGVTAVL